MVKRLNVLVLVLAGLMMLSCKANDVIIPDKDNALMAEEVGGQMTYEEAVRKHWKGQAKETKLSAKLFDEKSACFNSSKKRKRRSWNCNDCKTTDNAMLDGVKDSR